jgi:hypothetical protein
MRGNLAPKSRIGMAVTKSSKTFVGASGQDDGHVIHGGRASQASQIESE